MPEGLHWIRRKPGREAGAMMGCLRRSPRQEGGRLPAGGFKRVPALENGPQNLWTTLGTIPTTPRICALDSSRRQSAQKMGRKPVLRWDPPYIVA